MPRAVLASLMDGTGTLADMQEAMQRQFGQSVALSDVEYLVRQLRRARAARYRAISGPLEKRDRAVPQQSHPARRPRRRRLRGRARAARPAACRAVCRRKRPGAASRIRRVRPRGSAAC